MNSQNAAKAKEGKLPEGYSVCEYCSRPYPGRGGRFCLACSSRLEKVIRRMNDSPLNK